MNQNAYTRDYRHERYDEQDQQDRQERQEATSSGGGNTRYDELSSSGVESDWILFSPLSDQEFEAHGDVLSTSTDDMNHRVPEEEESDIEDDDDDDSLIESLGMDHLTLPVHDGTGSFVTPSLATHSQQSGEDYDYLQSLQKDDFITHRIDTWRKEQAKIMINDLHRHSLTSSSSMEQTRELLASWGVDDRLFIENDVIDDTQPRNVQKRFYGDDLLEGYTEWEVNKIKQVAQKLSSSLVRERSSTSSPMTTSFRARRSSLLLSISRSANKYFIEHTAMLKDQPFWTRDLSSAHSSLSLSTNSIMFGNLNIGEA